MITVRILGCPIRIRTVLTKVVCQRVIKGGQSSDVCILSNQRKWLSMATFTGSKRLNVYLLKCSTTRQSPVYLISSSTEEYGDFDSILEKIAQIRQENGEIVSEENLNEMNTKLQLLASYGCRFNVEDELENYLEIFNLSETQIKEKAEHLKSFQMQYLTPDLFIAGDLIDNALYQAALKQLEFQEGVKGRDNLMKKLLECCSEVEWNMVKPYLRQGLAGLHRLTCMEFLDLYKKIKFLIDQGFTPELIKSHPVLLSQKNIKERIEWIKKTIPFVKRQKQIEILTYNRNVLNAFKKKYEERLSIFLGCRTLENVEAKISMLDTYIKAEWEEERYQNLLKLKEKVDYLKSLGYNEGEIADNLLCLLPYLNKIRQHVKLFGNVFTIDISRDRTKAAPKMMVSYELSLMCKKFSIKHEDIVSLQAMALAKNVKVYNKTLRFLLQTGYSLKEIIQHVEVLGKQDRTVRRRLRIIEKNKLGKDKAESLPSLQILVMESSTFKPRVIRLKNYEEALATSDSKTEALSVLLNLEKSQENILDSMMNEKLTDLKERVQYLHSEGISSKEIVNDIFCLHIPLSSLKFAVAKLKKQNRNNIRLSDITATTGASVNKSLKTINIGGLVKKKLGLKNLKDWEKVDNEQFTISVADMNENFDLLVSEQFSVEDLRNCPYILGHSCDVLREALSKLKDSDEISLYPDISHDKVKLLNYLQYTIELEHGFRPVVNDQVLNIDETDPYMLLKD